MIRSDEVTGYQGYIYRKDQGGRHKTHKGCLFAHITLLSPQCAITILREKHAWYIQLEICMLAGYQL